MGRTAPETAALVSEWDAEYLRKCQAEDPDIGPAIEWLESNSRPPWEEIRSFSPALRALWQQYESLIMRDGVIYRIFHDSYGDAQYYQLVLPSKLKIPFLELVNADAAGHLKLSKCIPHVQRRAWWSTYRRDLKLFIDCCGTCASYHRGAAPKQGRLHPMILGAPCERWYIDLTGPHYLSDGYRYIFTGVCPFSKYAIAVPIRNKEATTVAKTLVQHVLLKWGLCYEVLSDLGKEFTNELSHELLGFWVSRSYVPRALTLNATA